MDETKTPNGARQSPDTGPSQIGEILPVVEQEIVTAGMNNAVEQKLRTEEVKEELIAALERQRTAFVDDSQTRLEWANTAILGIMNYISTGQRPKEQRTRR